MRQFYNWGFIFVVLSIIVVSFCWLLSTIIVVNLKACKTFRKLHVMNNQW